MGRTEDGIEIYETSDAIKELPMKQRQAEFLRIMRDEYRGRTARLAADNGQVYYATFDQTDARKNIYGDKKSDRAGYKAKINTGADGGIFDLVENAKHVGGKAEQGKNTLAHKDVSGWEYFVKTVQIDGKVYDLLANVRKKPDGEYVYSVQLNENKNKAPVLPSRQTSGFISEAGHLQTRAEASASGDSLSQKHSSVKEKFSMVLYDILKLQPTQITQKETGAAQSANPSPGAARKTAQVSKDTIAQKNASVKEKFSMDEPVEETGTLIALHNMSSEKIDQTLELGAWPSPSIAIVQAEQGHTEYGAYSALFFAQKKRTAQLLRPLGFVNAKETATKQFYGSISYKDDNVNIQGENFRNISLTRRFCRKRKK
ncbi:MAG: hypothetical protein LUJ09_08040 [Firmicutes bacterium]|nr:hypothetical protein [Bacillota bacterium]